MTHQTIGNLAADTRVNIEEAIIAIYENVDAVLFVLPDIDTSDAWKKRVGEEFQIIKSELEPVMTNTKALDQYFMDFLNYDNSVIARDLIQLSVQINTDLRELLTRLTYLVDSLSILSEEESVLSIIVTSASSKIFAAEDRFNQALSDMSNLVSEFFKLTQPDGIDQE